MSNFQNRRGNARGRGGNRPPPHLKGRAIGMWYANQSRLKKENEEEYFEPSISLPTEKVEEIRQYLNESRFLRYGNETTEQDSNSKKFQEDFQRVVSVEIEQQIRSKLANSTVKETGESPTEFDLKLLEEQKVTASPYQKFREKLPCWKKRQEIVETIRKNQIILIKGETGSGKTTQITQYILDDAISRGCGSQVRIICTQPRRISAVTVAERVASERAESLGKSVGYSIRLETKNPRQNGSIKYCTTGVLLKYLEDDPALLDYSIVILDEVHERDKISDVCLGILKKIFSYRKDFKLILMSATLKAEIFAQYFNNCPTIEIEGFTYPVKENYLEDVIEEIKFYEFQSFERKRFWGNSSRETEDNKMFEMFAPTMKELKTKYSSKTIEALLKKESEEINNNLLEDLIFHISYKLPEGAILVFLPGYAQISKLLSQLKSCGRFPENRFVLMPLHSILTGADQKRVFEIPPRGVRKVILSTNIAETSVTIEDIVYVINSGKRKQTTYDVENNIEVFQEHWVSKSNATQRKGRAGRCQPGVCYHLYSRARHETLDTDIVPEILRTRLHDTILVLKLLGFQDSTAFLKSLISVPHENVIENSINLLKRINALTSDEVLTPLGYHLAKIPADPQAAKMILLASFFNCTDPVTSISASLGFKDAFYNVIGKERETDAAKRKFSQNSKSDFLMMANVMTEWKKHKNQRPYPFCRDNFLSFQTLVQLERMKDQLYDLLKTTRFIDETGNPNRYSENLDLVKSIICAGLYPNIAKVVRVKTFRNQASGKPFIATKEEGRKVKIFPGSVLAEESQFDSNYLVFFHKQKSQSVFLHGCSTVSPYALIFWGDLIVHADEWIGVGDFLKFKCNTETQSLILDLREEWDFLLQKKIWDSSPIDWQGGEGKLMKAIIRLITMKRDSIFDEDVQSDE